VPALARYSKTPEMMTTQASTFRRLVTAE